MYNPQLETFIQAADSGSFSKAAEKLFISQTAVTKQINLLEDNLGIKLFNRTLKRAEDAQRKEANIIRIGTSPMTPSTMLVEIQKKIKHICPDLKFRLVPFENNPQNAREILSNLGEILMPYLVSLTMNF